MAVHVHTDAAGKIFRSPHGDYIGCGRWPCGSCLAGQIARRHFTQHVNPFSKVEHPVSEAG